jgi:phosphatidate cytidylyltransferase
MKKEFEKRLISSLILIPITLFFIVKGSVFFLFFLCIFFIATSYEWIKMNKKKTLKLFGLLYLFIAFSSAYFLRLNFGVNIFLFIILICIFTDLGGYIFGKMFKGPRLTKISPNKTYAGMLGSFILSIIAGSVFTAYQNTFTILEVSIFLINDLNYILIILFISLISQIGDLIISYFKRLAKIKDTGKFIPGHGGLLDRVDGIIFAIPASYLLFNFLI